jgi:GT2 family glycosyltransferase
MNHTPLVSIVILNYNGKDLLKECLDSVRGLNYRNFEAIVVDNSSTDGSTDMVRSRYPWATVLVTPRMRIAQAGNRGLKVAKGEIIVPMFNNDMTVEKYWLDHLVTALGESEVGIVDSKVYSYGSNVISTAGNMIRWNFGWTISAGSEELDLGQYDTPREVDYAEVMVIRRDVVESIGGFDEKYFFYWSDIDFCVRAKRAGYKTLYVPGAVVWHRDAATIGGNSPRRHYSYFRDSLRFLVKNSSAQCVLYRLFSWFLFTLGIIMLGVHPFMRKSDLAILQLRAFGWNLLNLKDTMRSRGIIRLPV